MTPSTGIAAAPLQAGVAASRQGQAAARELRVPSRGSLSGARQRVMLEAGLEVLECRRVLEKGGLNLVGEVLRGQGEFLEFSHYPEDDVYDRDTHSQYYYHAHRGGMAGEHGHFHTFIRDPERILGKCPIAAALDSEDIAHLIAVSMDPYGWPIGLFATNRWVTGERWCAADDVVALAKRFRVDHAHPSWPVNRWLTAMFVLFGPHIEALLRHRDEVVADWAQNRALEDVFEDRDLEVTGYLSISVDELVRDLQAAVGGPKRE
jgi:hypothetical protein